MTHQDHHAALWAAIAVLAISVMLLALAGCAAHHELCVEARVERTTEPAVVAVYKMEMVR